MFNVKSRDWFWRRMTHSPELVWADARWLKHTGGASGAQSRLLHQSNHCVPPTFFIFWLTVISSRTDLPWVHLSSSRASSVTVESPPTVHRASTSTKKAASTRSEVQALDLCLAFPCQQTRCQYSECGKICHCHIWHPSKEACHER